MMKKRLSFLLLPLVAIISSCSFLDIFSSSSRISPTPITSREGNPEATGIRYTVDDLSDGGVFDTPNCPVNGSPNILVIPIWFTDSGNYLTNDTYRNNVLEDIETAFFGTAEEAGWHSVSSYYEESSCGILTLQGTMVKEWYVCGYSSSDIASKGTSLVNTIVRNAVNAYFEEHTSDSRRNYDSDGDGYIDAVSLIYASPVYADLGYESYNHLWAFTYWLQDHNPNYLAPTPNTYFWSSYEFMYSPQTVYGRTGSREYYYGSTDGLSGSNPLDTHTFIHEFGHVLGLDDLYDYSGEYCPSGSFSMQDHNVGGHDPLSVLMMGWSSPYIPTESCSVTIGAFQSTRELILLTPEWNSYDSPFDEYLLLELYTPTGLNDLDSTYKYGGSRSSYPSGTRQTGIRLWHVDARLATYNGNGTLNDISHLATCPIYSDAGYTPYYVNFAFSNTYWSDSSYDSYCSPFGEEYSDFNQLQLIRSSKSATYYPTDELSADDLFLDGSSFSMEEYARQFVNGTSLDSGKALGWSFSVSISGSGEEATATVTCTRE